MRSILARDVMTQDVLVVPSTMTVSELADFLIDNEVTGAPVEDESGSLVGVVSVVDIAAHAGEGASIGRDNRPDFYLRGWEESYAREEMQSLRVLEESLTVADIMNPTVYTVESDCRVGEVASRMLRSHIHRLLVTEDDKIVGIITTSDLLGLLVEDE